VSFRKVLFVGLGGAGQRHLRILRRLLPDITVCSAYRHTATTPLLRADFTVDERSSVESEYGVKRFESLESAFADRPDLTVIATPTSCHRAAMMRAMEAGSAVLVEKPWAENLDEFAAFRDGMLSKDLPFLISFQRRFHPLIAAARDAIARGVIGKPIAASFTVFSNVRAWHPYEDWHQLYAVQPQLGGGVLLTEIHEIDLANWFFGLPDGVFCRGGNWSGEKLGVEDTVQLTLTYAGLSVQMTLCFMHEKQGRQFHVAGTEGDIVWDADGNRLTIMRFGEPVEQRAEPQFSNDAMFVAQAQRFVSGWTQADSRESLAAAGGSLAVVDAARRSMASGCIEPVDSSVVSGIRG
jgi:predicted dehydrogenase